MMVGKRKKSEGKIIIMAAILTITCATDHRSGLVVLAGQPTFSGSLRDL